MQTANFITASAEVTSITKLKKGDVYKRLDEPSYGSDKIVHGIVLDVLYNGTDAAIQTMEFTGGYRSFETTFNVFGGNKDIKIFPSTKEEVKEYLKQCVVSLTDKVRDAEKSVDEAKSDLARANEVVSGDLIKKLTTPEYAGEPTKAIEEKN